MTTVGDPLTDIGWMELLWMQPMGITSHGSSDDRGVPVAL